MRTVRFTSDEFKESLIKFLNESMETHDHDGLWDEFMSIMRQRGMTSVLRKLSDEVDSKPSFYGNHMEQQLSEEKDITVMV